MSRDSCKIDGYIIYYGTPYNKQLMGITDQRGIFKNHIAIHNIERMEQIKMERSRKHKRY